MKKSVNDGSVVFLLSPLMKISLTWTEVYDDVRSFNIWTDDSSALSSYNNNEHHQALSLASSAEPKCQGSVLLRWSGLKLKVSFRRDWEN